MKRAVLATMAMLISAPALTHDLVPGAAARPATYGAYAGSGGVSNTLSIDPGGGYVAPSIHLGWSGTAPDPASRPRGVLPAGTVGCLGVNHRYCRDVGGLAYRVVVRGTSMLYIHVPAVKFWGWVPRED